MEKNTCITISEIILLMLLPFRVSRVSRFKSWVRRGSVGSTSARCKGGPDFESRLATPERCLPLSFSAMKEWRGASANVHGCKNV